MKTKAIFNHRGEPCITIEPETQEDTDILSTLHGKYTRDDGRHQLVMGCFTNEGRVKSATFTVNPDDHPTVIAKNVEQINAMLELRSALSATEAECAGLKTLLAQKQCEACGGLLTPSADLVAECAKLREGNEAMCRTMAKMAQLQITVEMQRDAAAARVAELEKAAHAVDSELARHFWTSDDGENQRDGTPEDEEIPTHIRLPWLALRALLAPTRTEGKAE